MNCNYTANCETRCKQEKIKNFTHYTEYGKCPPGYVDYGILLQFVTPKYMEYCKTNPCPICLSSNTIIDTPKGPIKIKDVKPGMILCKVNKNGKRMPTVVLKTSKSATSKTMVKNQNSFRESRVWK